MVRAQPRYCAPTVHCVPTTQLSDRCLSLSQSSSFRTFFFSCWAFQSALFCSKIARFSGSFGGRLPMNVPPLPQLAGRVFFFGASPSTKVVPEESEIASSTTSTFWRSLLAPSDGGHSFSFLRRVLLLVALHIG